MQTYMNPLNFYEHLMIRIEYDNIFLFPIELHDNSHYVIFIFLLSEAKQFTTYIKLPCTITVKKIDSNEIIQYKKHAFNIKIVKLRLKISNYMVHHSHSTKKI